MLLRGLQDSFDDSLAPVGKISHFKAGRPVSEGAILELTGDPSGWRSRLQSALLIMRPTIGHELPNLLDRTPDDGAVLDRGHLGPPLNASRRVATGVIMLARGPSWDKWRSFQKASKDK